MIHPLDDYNTALSRQRASHSHRAFALPTAETLGYHVSSRFYRGALGVLLIYDVTKSSSFSNIKTWVEELREHACPHVVAMLVGNKSDLGALRVVPGEVAAEFASAFRHDHASLTARGPFYSHTTVCFVQRKTA
jgi:GTPase SAR1 family protein